MTYTYGFTSNAYSKWDTIQEDVADMYSYINEDIEEDEDVFFDEEELEEEFGEYEVIY